MLADNCSAVADDVYFLLVHIRISEIAYYCLPAISGRQIYTPAIIFSAEWYFFLLAFKRVLDFYSKKVYVRPLLCFDNYAITSSY